MLNLSGWAAAGIGFTLENGFNYYWSTCGSSEQLSTYVQRNNRSFFNNPWRIWATEDTSGKTTKSRDLLKWNGDDGILMKMRLSYNCARIWDGRCSSSTR